MSTTDNLALTLIETNQSQKEVTANEAFSGLDAALCETLDVQVEDGTNAVAAAAVRSAVQLVLLDEGSPGLSAAFTLELAAVKRLLVITNTTAYDATVACDGAASGAEEVVVAAAGTRTVYCDGTQVFGMTADATGVPESFVDLTDTPANYTSAASKLVRVNSGATALEFVTHKQAIQIACSDETTDLAVDTAVVTFRMPYAFTLTGVRASVTTAPTGAALSIGINEGGSSILSTDLTIDASEKTSTTAATPAVISDSALADDAEITIDIDQIGSTVAGAGLKVTLLGYPT